MPGFRKRCATARALVLMAVAACQPRPVEHAPMAESPGLGALMLGTWEIGPAEGRGPLIGFTVDSAAGERFYGRLTMAFAGDMGEDPAAFPPFEGRVTPDTTARITILRTGFDVPAFDLVVQPRDDTIDVHAYRWGGENMMGTGRAWRGRRVAAGR